MKKLSTLDDEHYSQISHYHTLTLKHKSVLRTQNGGIYVDLHVKCSAYARGSVHVPGIYIIELGAQQELM